ncbi:hypothetical protein ACLXBB_37300, partial [Pseudomonas aeruginosa]
AEQVQLRLNRGESAEAAWSRVAEDSAAQQEALHDALLAEQVQLRLNRGESAEAAWSRVAEDSAAQQEALH